MATAEMRRSTLQRKDRDELTQIAETLGAKPPPRARKGEIIDLILKLVSGDNDAADAGAADTAETPASGSAASDPATASDSAVSDAAAQDRPDSGSRRRRRRGRDRENPENDNEDFDGEPVTVAGHLDLRNEGYGFLRVAGYLACRDDCYVPVKLVRRHGLRKGDFIVGAARPAGRSEKNPALISITEINGAAPETAADRPHFDDLTPVFPSERLALERAKHAQPADAVAARAIDLVTPVGKGQRGLIVAPRRAGKTTILKQIVRALETNGAALEVMVLLIDGRPEEATELNRCCEAAEVIASTFDKPAEEHVAIAEMAVERAKRMAERGVDVGVVIDSLTRLSRAYATDAAQGTRAKSPLSDIAAIQPAKRLFAAGRNLEEAGSVTVLATVSADSGSAIDEMILEEFRPAANLELRLDPQIAAMRIFPAVDLADSFTSNEELLLEARPLDQLHRLRSLLEAAADPDSPSASLQALLDHLGSHATNRELFARVVSA